MGQTLSEASLERFVQPCGMTWRFSCTTCALVDGAAKLVAMTAAHAKRVTCMRWKVQLKLDGVVERCDGDYTEDSSWTDLLATLSRNYEYIDDPAPGTATIAP